MEGAGGAHPPPTTLDDLRFSNTTGILQKKKEKKKTMWSISVEVEQETSAAPPKRNPGFAPDFTLLNQVLLAARLCNLSVVV